MANAILFDILENIHSQIVGLALLGLSDTNVLIQKAAATRTKDLPAEKFPCVIVAPFGAESVEPASNLRDDVTYPVLIAICASEAQEAELPQSEQRQNFNLYLTWRERIRQAFSTQRLTSTLCHVVRVTPLAIADRDAWFGGKWVSGLVLQCTQREART